MTDAEVPSRPGPPIAGSEVDTLIGALERQRSYVAWKCGGVDRAGLSATVGASTMTLGGLLKHLALVEDEYFTRQLHGREYPAPFYGVDFDADPEWEWRTSADDTPEELLALWESSVRRSRLALAEALETGGLDALIARKWPDGRAPSVRRIMIDMIEEYARHVGHIDLVRESVDGLVGEDPED